MVQRNLTDYITVILLQATHKRSLQSFALPLRMNGMHKTQFDHVHLHLLLLAKLWLLLVKVPGMLRSPSKNFVL